MVSRIVSYFWETELYPLIASMQCIATFWLRINGVSKRDIKMDIMVIIISSIVIVSGTPILRLDVCSESEVSFTCTVNETSTLGWNIDFLSHQDVDRVVYLPTDPIGHNLVATNGGTGVNYHFNLTSKSPLTSTMSTSTPTDLYGATVSCSEGQQMSADNVMATLTLHDHVSSRSLNITMLAALNTCTPVLESIEGLLHWDIQKDMYSDIMDVLNTLYIITLTPESEKLNQSIFETSNISIPLTLFLNQGYNISVVARNCIGSSEPAIIHIRIIQFDNNCILIVKDGVMVLAMNCCLSSATKTTTDEVTVNNFTTDSTLDLTTQQHDLGFRTIDPLVPSMIASHLFLSAFSCTVGIFIGFLLYRCYISKRAQQTTAGPPEPVYTEIALSANEAYGRVN